MIDDHTLVTAGHVVYNHGQKHPYRRPGKHAVEILVYLGYNGRNPDPDQNTHRELRRATRVAVHYKWYISNSSTNDLAVIQVAPSFVDVTPILYSNTPLSGDTVLRVVGYPGDIPQEAKGQFMYESVGDTQWDLEEMNWVLKHSLDTYGGK